MPDLGGAALLVDEHDVRLLGAVDGAHARVDQVGRPPHRQRERRRRAAGRRRGRAGSRSSRGRSSAVLRTGLPGRGGRTTRPGGDQGHDRGDAPRARGRRAPRERPLPATIASSGGGPTSTSSGPRPSSPSGSSSSRWSPTATAPLPSTAPTCASVRPPTVCSTSAVRRVCRRRVSGQVCNSRRKTCTSTSSARRTRAHDRWTRLRAVRVTCSARSVGQPRSTSVRTRGCQRRPTYAAKSSSLARSTSHQTIPRRFASTGPHCRCPVHRRPGVAPATTPAPATFSP